MARKYDFISELYPRLYLMSAEHEPHFSEYQRVCMLAHGELPQHLRTYAVPKRMYKKDGSVGESEKFPGLNAKKAVVDEG